MRSEYFSRYGVDSDVLPVFKARAETAPQVFETKVETKTSAGDMPGARKPLPRKGNVQGPRLSEKGNIEEGFKQADAVVEGTYATQVQTHSALETHGFVAKWEGDELTVWASTQGIFSVREELAGRLAAEEIEVLLAEYGDTPEDPVPVAKALQAFVRTNPQLLIKLGLVEGKVVQPAELKALADLPSKEQLRSQIVGAVQGPMAQLVSLLQAPLRELVHVLDGILLINIGYALVPNIERDRLPSLFLTTPDDLTKRRIAKYLMRSNSAATE